MTKEEKEHGILILIIMVGIILAAIAYPHLRPGYCGGCGTPSDPIQDLWVGLFSVGAIAVVIPLIILVVMFMDRIVPRSPFDT